MPASTSVALCPGTGQLWTAQSAEKAASAFWNPVQHDPARAGRELVRVHRAEPRAVGEAEVGQAVVADPLPDDVEVAGGVLGAEPGQQPAGDLRAGLGQLGGAGDLAEVAAGDRRRAGDTARVEADQVVAPVEAGQVRAPGVEFGDAGDAGPAEVHRERPEPQPGAGGGQSAHGEVEGGAAGVPVVQRHCDRAALGLGRRLRIRTGAPVHPLLVEPAQIGSGVGRGGPGHRDDADQTPHYRGRQPP
jgi:hypothetical protein